MQKALAFIFFYTVFNNFTFAQVDSTQMARLKVREKRDQWNRILFLLTNDLENNPSFIAYNGISGVGTIASVTAIDNRQTSIKSSSRLSFAPRQKQSSGWLNFALRYEKAEEGLYRSRVVALSYAPRFSINENSSIAVGFEFQFLKLQFNQNNSTFPDMVDSISLGFNKNTKTPPTGIVDVGQINFGLTYEREKFIIQGQLQNSTSSHVGFYKTPGPGHSFPKIYSVQPAYFLQVSRHLSFVPFVQYYHSKEYDDDNRNSIQIGTNAAYHSNYNLNAGIAWNSNSFLTTRLGYNIRKKYRFYMVYTNHFGLSQTLNKSLNTFQISFNYSLFPFIWSMHHGKF